jgi:hypothetical protein
VFYGADRNTVVRRDWYRSPRGCRRSRLSPKVCRPFPIPGRPVGRAVASTGLVPREQNLSLRAVGRDGEERRDHVPLSGVAR